MCCADHTGYDHGDLSPSSSFECLHNRGKQRFLRRLVETLRPSKQASRFLKDRFASSNLEIRPVISKKVANDPTIVKGASAKPPAKMHSLCRDEEPADSHDRTYLPVTYAMNSAPPSSHQVPHPHVASFSSMSLNSEFDERDTRSERVTRRVSYCSDREGIEEERQPLEPEGFVTLAVE